MPQDSLLSTSTSSQHFRPCAVSLLETILDGFQNHPNPKGSIKPCASRTHNNHLPQRDILTKAPLTCIPLDSINAVSYNNVNSPSQSPDTLPAPTLMQMLTATPTQQPPQSSRARNAGIILPLKPLHNITSHLPTSMQILLLPSCINPSPPNPPSQPPTPPAPRTQQPPHSAPPRPKPRACTDPSAAFSYSKNISRCRIRCCHCPSLAERARGHFDHGLGRSVYLPRSSSCCCCLRG